MSCRARVSSSQSACLRTHARSDTRASSTRARACAPAAKRVLSQRARTLRTRAAGDDDDKGLPPNFAEDSPEAKAEKAREEARRELLSTPLKPTPGGGRFGKIKQDGPDDFGAAGSTRGGEYGLGPLTDKALNAWASENGLLFAGIAVLALVVVLLLIGPPPPSPSSLY